MPILPPTSTSRPAARKRWPISAVVVDLPLVPVIATSRGAGAGDLALEHFRIADDFDSGGARLGDRPVRLGMSERHAGAQDQRIERRRNRASRRSATGRPAACGLRHRLGRIVPGMNLGAAKPQRLDAGRARARQPEDRNFLAREMRSLETSPPHLSLRVERPMSASTKAMIQKRMTMVGSFQPFCSK